MATLTRGGLFSRLRLQPKHGKSKKVHEIALRAYKQTNGATDELKRLYKAYKDNQAKSGESGDAGGPDR